MTKLLLAIFTVMICFPAFAQDDSTNDLKVTVKGTSLRVYVPGMDPRDPVRISFNGGSTKVQKTLWRSDDSSEQLQLRIQSKNGDTASRVVYTASFNVF